MTIRTQYVANDGTPFSDEEEARAYERELERANGSKHSYHVKLFIECSCHVEAVDEEEAAEIAEDQWFVGVLEHEEEIYDIQAYEE